MAEFLVASEDIAPISRDLPSSIEIENAPYRTQVLQAVQAERPLRIWNLQGALSVDGRRGEIYLDGKLFVPSAVDRTLRRWFRVRVASHRARSRFGSRHVGSVLSLRNAWEQAYYHAFADSGAKLFHAQQLGLTTQVEATVPARWSPRNPARTVLGAFAPNLSLVDQGRREILLPERVLFVQRPYHYAPAWSALANAIEEEPTERKWGPRIVLDRSLPGAVRRDCVGYESLAEALVRLGYQRLDPAGLTLGQQKYVFSRAEHVVSVNGSALTNMAFCSPGQTQFDTIIPQHWPTVTFATLASALGHPLRAFLVASKGRRSTLSATLDRQTAEAILATAKRI